MPQGNKQKRKSGKKKEEIFVEMLGAKSAGLGLALGLASLALVDNTMFIGRYCEHIIIMMALMIKVMMMPADTKLGSRKLNSDSSV